MAALAVFPSAQGNDDVEHFDATKALVEKMVMTLVGRPASTRRTILCSDSARVPSQSSRYSFNLLAVAVGIFAPSLA